MCKVNFISSREAGVVCPLVLSADANRERQMGRLPRISQSERERERERAKEMRVH